MAESRQGNASGSRLHFWESSRKADLLFLPSDGRCDPQGPLLHNHRQFEPLKADKAEKQKYSNTHPGLLCENMHS